MRWLLLVLVTIVAPSGARADAISGPPACPPGARGAASHAGQWCAPWPCTSDTECEGGTCRDWRVCTRPAMVHPGGLGGIDRPPSRMELVVGTCDPAVACTGTEEPPPVFAGTFEPDAPTCTEARVCVPAALPPLPPRSTGVPSAIPSSPLSPPPPPPLTAARGCACRAGPTRGSLAPPALALAVIALVARRRR